MPRVAIHRYTFAVDMWSVGCIFGEMLLSQPVFPGNDYIHQLKLIVKMLGKAPDEDLWFVSNPNALNFMKQLPKYEPQPLEEKFPGAPAAAPVLLASDGNTSALTTYGIGAMLAEKLSLNTRIPSTAIHGAHACPAGVRWLDAASIASPTANPAMPPSATGRRPTASMIAPILLPTTSCATPIKHTKPMALTGVNPS